MNTNKLLDELKLMYSKLGRGMLNALRAKDKRQLYDDIVNSTRILDSLNPSIGQRIQWLLSKKSNFSKCKTCGKEIHKLNMLGDMTEFAYCSSKCAANNNKTKEKRIKTCLEKYGVENIAAADIVKRQKKRTCLERYGTENVFANERIKKKIQQTKLRLHNDIHFTNIDKAKQTCLERYGTENVFANESIKKKIQQTKLSKYGTRHHMQCKEIAERISEKARHTTLQKTYNEFISNNDYSQPEFSEKFFIENFSPDFKFTFKCKKCKKTFQTACYMRRLHRCPTCYPLGSHSYMEDDIMTFINDQYDGDIVHGKGARSIISPYEIDIYVPNRHLAIEFDGLYWHSEDQGKNNKYHLKKTMLCEDNGIQLIHIFEDEWICRQDIVKSRLKNLLGVYDRTVYARNCVVKEVDSKTSRQFQEDNHIQGAVNARVNLGLYLNDELISLMTFGKTRFDKKHEWELVRFCNKLGCHVPGGASKLLKYFEKTYCPKSLVSYADRRWSQGKLYYALGFKLDHISAPNYWYFKDALNRESRIQFQKHKLKDKLEKFDPNLSEVQNMKMNGYSRIFDCGNMVFEKLYQVNISRI